MLSIDFSAEFIIFAGEVAIMTDGVRVCVCWTLPMYTMINFCIYAYVHTWAYTCTYVYTCVCGWQKLSVQELLLFLIARVAGWPPIHVAKKSWLRTIHSGFGYYGQLVAHMGMQELSLVATVIQQYWPLSTIQVPIETLLITMNYHNHHEKLSIIRFTMGLTVIEPIQNYYLASVLPKY